jgi:hypothetical protein
MPTPTFSLTPADFGRLQKVVVRRFRRKLGFFSFPFFLRVLVWGCLGFAAAGYARLMRDFPEATEPMKMVAVSLVVAIAAIMAMPYWSELAARRHVLDPKGAFLSPQTVEFSTSGLRIESSTGSTSIPWSGFLALDEDEANYYLFVDAIQAFVLPRKALADVLAEFEQYTKHLRGAA